MKVDTITRSLKLAIFANPTKLDTARYTLERFKLFTQHFVQQLYYLPAGTTLSTQGMGHLANQGQHKASGILRSARASHGALTKLASKPKSNSKAPGKLSIPQLSAAGCPVKLELSKDSSFDYWAKVSNQFGGAPVELPLKSHKRLNQWLKKGYTLAQMGELHQDKNGKFYIIVYVQKDIPRATPKAQSLGCDVGYRNSVARSDGYIGANTAKPIQKQKSKNAEQRRQAALEGRPYRSKSVKTHLKQLLDVEARRAVRVAQANGWNLVVEDPKVIANLSSGKLQGWARSYFANRCGQLAQEYEVFIWTTNPAYTSQTCSVCAHVDKQSRVKSAFKCTSCNYESHADVNAACNIAQKGTASLLKLLSKRSGAVNEISAVSG